MPTWTFRPLRCSEAGNSSCLKRSIQGLGLRVYRRKLVANPSFMGLHDVPYNPYITHYSSLHFLFHYPNITLIYTLVQKCCMDVTSICFACQLHPSRPNVGLREAHEIAAIFEGLRSRNTCDRATGLSFGVFMYICICFCYVRASSDCLQSHKDTVAHVTNFSEDAL